MGGRPFGRGSETRHMIKLIKTSTDYDAALARLEQLATAAPAPGSPEAEQLELLGLLIEEYERAAQPAPKLDPIDAIEFRMDQLGLRPRDLIPYIGSRSKVSEVLSRKRPLTLPMIRALHSHLGIPSEALIRERTATEPADPLPETAPATEPLGGTTGADLARGDTGAGIPWERFPLLEMVKRGWISGLSEVEAKAARKTRDAARTFLAPFFGTVGGAQLSAVLRRQADHVRGGRAMDKFALAAWTARVMTRAAERPPTRAFVAEVFDDDEWVDHFVRLSQYEDGPRRAVDALAEVGVVALVEPQLPRIHLDGAAFRLPTGEPVVALTLRHDRLDNFWFTLCHELAHLVLHLSPAPSDELPAAGATGDVNRGESTSPATTGQSPESAGSASASDMVSERFFDDLETFEGIDPREQEADAWAGEILVPEDAWRASAVPYTPSPLTVTALAEEIGVSPAVVAGRARFAQRNYRILNGLVGHGAVRRLFPEVEWPD